jgi:hypothetical protein
MGKIVETAGVVTRSGNLGQVIQDAMTKAVLDCLAEGISDPEIHLSAKMAAREDAKAAYLAEQEALRAKEADAAE